MKGLSGRLLDLFSLTLISVLVSVIKTLSLLGRVTSEQKTNVARYEIISHLLNVPLLWDVTLFRLSECFPAFGKIVVSLFQG
jgi:hypothetical protein